MTVLGGLLLTGCLVSTDATDEQVYELNEVSGVDVDRIPRASEAEAAEGPRRPDPGTSPDAAADPASPGPELTQTTPADGGELTDATIGSTADSSSDATQDTPAEANPVEAPRPTETPDNAEPATSTGLPEPTIAPATTAPPTPATTASAPTAVPAPATEVPAAPTEVSPAPVVTAPSTPAPQVNQVAATTAGPLASDNLAVTEAVAVAPDGSAPLLSESGALACSIVELSLDELDRGDLADFGADMSTAAGFASAAPESGLNALAASLPGAATSANPIDVVGAFLTACATYGYEI